MVSPQGSQQPDDVLHIANDLDDQMRMLHAEPFVQRTQEFFFMIKDFFGRDSTEFHTFKALCNQSNL